MFTLKASEFERLVKATKEFEGNAEAIINDVLHNQAGELIQDSVRRLIPVSGRTWKGKKSPAKTTKSSLKQVNENLRVTIKSSKNYQYLYFPNDGTSTKRHAGNQQFFERGGEAVQEEIINRCVKKLINNL